MKRPRDNQRKKVYDSEKLAFGEHYHDTPPEFPKLEEVAAFVWTVTRTCWWQNRGGGLVRVLDGRGRNRGRAYPRAGKIAMPRFTRRRWYILHELAHIIAPFDAAWHGPEFCAIYLELLRRFGEPGDADKLKEAFKEKRVKHRRPNVCYS